MQKIFTKEFKPGEKWSGAIGRNKYIHFKALGDNANVSVLLYNMLDTSERYNMPDTLKAQYTAHLTKGNVLLSDNGRVLASITEDSLGWHDTISGHTTRLLTDRKYGKTTYQEHGNEYCRCGEENFKVELIRNNMSKRDIVPCINLFSKVYVEDDGSMIYPDAMETVFFDFTAGRKPCGKHSRGFGTLEHNKNIYATTICATVGLCTLRSPSARPAC